MEICIAPSDDVDSRKEAVEFITGLAIKCPVIMNPNAPGAFCSVEPTREHPGTHEPLFLSREHMDGWKIGRRLLKCRKIIAKPCEDLSRGHMVVPRGAKPAFKVSSQQIPRSTRRERMDWSDHGRSMGVLDHVLIIVNQTRNRDVRMQPFDTFFSTLPNLRYLDR